MTDQSYQAKDIQVLEGLEPVRRRPGMYIGSTDLRGLHHLLVEIVDNSIDEALAGFAKNVWVIIEKDNKVTVADDGRGIPVEKHPKVQKSSLEVAMTMLHAGGKFGQGAYKISGLRCSAGRDALRYRPPLWDDNLRNSNRQQSAEPKLYLSRASSSHSALTPDDVGTRGAARTMSASRSLCR